MPDVRAAGDDATSQEPVAGDLRVEAQESLADAERVRVGDAEADVVAECADVGDVVVETFELEENRTQHLGGGRGGCCAGFFDGEAVGEGVADGGVAGDPLRQLDTFQRVPAFEESFDSFVDEPESSFDVEDGLANHGEPEVSGLDDTGVDRPDGNLIDAGSFNPEERIGLVFVGEWRWIPGVVAHGMPALGPVLVQDEARGSWMTDGFDAEEVVHLAFEAAGGKGEIGQAWNRGRVCSQSDVKLDTRVGRAAHQEVDDADGLAAHRACIVVVRSDEGGPVALAEVVAEVSPEIFDVGLDDRPAGRPDVVHPVTTRAAAWRRRSIGQIDTPSTATASSPATSTAPAVRDVW